MTDRALSLLIWVQGIGLGLIFGAHQHTTLHIVGDVLVAGSSLVLIVSGLRRRP